jgi:hypothetical protein
MIASATSVSKALTAWRGARSSGLAVHADADDRVNRRELSLQLGRRPKIKKKPGSCSRAFSYRDRGKPLTPIESNALLGDSSRTFRVTLTAP